MASNFYFVLYILWSTVQRLYTLLFIQILMVYKFWTSLKPVRFWALPSTERAAWYPNFVLLFTHTYSFGLEQPNLAWRPIWKVCKGLTISFSSSRFSILQLVTICTLISHCSWYFYLILALTVSPTFHFYLYLFVIRITKKKLLMNLRGYGVLLARTD